MSKIYTKTGDLGETGLWGHRRVSKADPQVQAYGDVDELNSVLGLAIVSLPARKNLDSLRRSLARIQGELFTVGSIVATPNEARQRLTPPFDRGMPLEASVRLEHEIDRMTAETKVLKHFILPGGACPAAWLHFARAVCRRAEREVVGLREVGAMPDSVIVYLNRLSDFLFTAARWTNHQLKGRETEWPGLDSENSTGLS